MEYLFLFNVKTKSKKKKLVEYKEEFPKYIKVDVKIINTICKIFLNINFLSFCKFY